MRQLLQQQSCAVDVQVLLATRFVWELRRVLQLPRPGQSIPREYGRVAGTLHLRLPEGRQYEHLLLFLRGSVRRALS